MLSKNGCKKRFKPDNPARHYRGTEYIGTNHESRILEMEEITVIDNVYHQDGLIIANWMDQGWKFSCAQERFVLQKYQLDVTQKTKMAHFKDITNKKLSHHRFSTS